MRRMPTYTATEIKAMCACIDIDLEGCEILRLLIMEEINLYGPEDMEDLLQASMMLFTRALLVKSIKGL